MSTTPPTPSGVEASGTAARRARQESRRQSERAPTAPARAAATRSVDDPASSPATAPVSPGAHRSGRELDPDALAALEEERAFLLGSLDDLEREHDAGDVDDTDYVVLKDDYTARAAAVIRSIDQREAAFERARPPRRRGRVLAWVAVLLVASVGLGVFVANSSGRRDPGESSSGDIRQTSRDLLLQAASLASADPPDYRGAIELYDEVLAGQPANTEALTYKAWLLFQTSRATEDPADTQLLLGRANELLDQAVEIDPAYGDARVFRASVLDSQGRYADALADLDAVRPGSIPADMSGLVDRLRSRIQGELDAAGTGPGASSATTVVTATP